MALADFILGLVGGEGLEVEQDEYRYIAREVQQEMNLPPVVEPEIIAAPTGYGYHSPGRGQNGESAN